MKKESPVIPKLPTENLFKSCRKRQRYYAESIFLIKGSEERIFRQDSPDIYTQAQKSDFGLL
jgi:hypothetical protein